MVIAVAAAVISGSCRSDRTSATGISWGDSVTFNTGFPLNDHLSGVCQCLNPSDTNDRVYFADVVTHKKISIFSSTGVLLQSVPLDAALDSLGQIDGITILHPDTIVLCGRYNNRIAIIDREGSCSVLADLSEHLRRPDGLTYELWCSKFSPFVLEHRAYFHIALDANSIGAYRGPDAPRGNEVYTYEWLARNGPHFASLDLGSIADSCRLIWGPVQPHLDTIREIPVVDHGSYACLNGQCFAFSIYSPVFHTLDPEGMASAREFTVRSAFTSVSREPIMLPKGGLVGMQDSTNDRLYNGGFIETLHFDRPSQHYLVVLRHRVIKVIVDGKELRRGAYTLQEYDDDFTFIRETPITDGQHRIPFMLCLSNGSFVIRSENKREMMSGIHTFDRLVNDVD